MSFVRRGVLIGTLAGLFVLVMAADAMAGGREDEATAVRTSVGVTHLVIDRPDARTSKAWRGGRAGQVMAPREASTDGDLRLTSGVIVRVARPGDLATFARGRNVTPVLPKLGYWRVETDSVGEAIVLADELAVEREALSAAVDVEWPWVTREIPNDPYLDEQWHLINTLDSQFDVNAEAAWNLGYTGAGVVLGWWNWRGRTRIPTWRRTTTRKPPSCAAARRVRTRRAWRVSRRRLEIMSSWGRGWPTVRICRS